MTVNGAGQTRRKPLLAHFVGQLQRTGLNVRLDICLPFLIALLDDTMDAGVTFTYSCRLLSSGARSVLQGALSDDRASHAAPGPIHVPC